MRNFDDEKRGLKGSLFSFTERPQHGVRRSGRAEDDPLMQAIVSTATNGLAVRYLPVVRWKAKRSAIAWSLRQFRPDLRLRSKMTNPATGEMALWSEPKVGEVMK